MKILTKNLIMSSLNIWDYIKLRKFLKLKEVKEELTLEQKNNVLFDFLDLNFKNNSKTNCIVIHEKKSKESIGIILGFNNTSSLLLDVSIVLKDEFKDNEEYIKEIISNFSKSMLNKYPQLIFNVSTFDISIQNFFESINIPKRISISDKIYYFYIITKNI